MTCAATRWWWRTRSARTSRCCARPCCPGLFRVLARNVGRGFADTALFEIGLVFRPRPGAAASAPILPVDRGPSVAELASLEAALPDQPLRVGAVLAGERELDGWWGKGRAASWADAIEAARAVGRICRVRLDVRADKHAPWHPGRCAAIYAQVTDSDGPREWLAGHAGELHPRVIQAFGLPERTCAMELDLSVMFTAAEAVGPVQAPRLSAYPLATQDVALIVDAAVPAAEVEAALVAGAPRTCSRTCGCSTCTPGPRSASSASRWPTRSGSAPRTGRSPPPRPRRPATRPWPRPPAGSAPSCAARNPAPAHVPTRALVLRGAPPSIRTPVPPAAAPYRGYPPTVFGHDLAAGARPGLVCCERRQLSVRM